LTAWICSLPLFGFTNYRYAPKVCSGAIFNHDRKIEKEGVSP